MGITIFRILLEDGDRDVFNLPVTNFSCTIVSDFSMNFSPSSISSLLWSPTTTPTTYSKVMLFPMFKLLTHLEIDIVYSQMQWAAVRTIFLLISVPPHPDTGTPSNKVPLDRTVQGFELGLTSHASGPLTLPWDSIDLSLIQSSPYISKHCIA